MLVKDLQPADGPSVRGKICSDLRAGSAEPEVTAEIASSQVHVLELQVMKTTRLGRRLASRVHKEQMVQQMPSRATALLMLIGGGRVAGMRVSLLEPPLPLLPTHPNVLTLARVHRASSTSLILRFPLELEELFGVGAFIPTVGDR